MKRVKQFFVCFFALMAITSVTNGVWASDFTDGTLFYKILSASEVAVCPENGSPPLYNVGNEPTGNITIPATVINGGTTYNVTTIGKSAFQNCTSLTSITIPAGVTTIEKWAFTYCTSLTSITIPAGVTTIGDEAFQACTALTSITIPSSVTAIGKAVFYYCDALTAITVDAGNMVYASEDGVLYNNAKTMLIQYPRGKTGTSFTIPASVTTIGENAFRACTALTSVIIPASVTTIGDEAFRACTALTSITIPSSVTAIGKAVFYYCTALTAITVDTGNTAYASEDGVLYNKAKTTLIQYPGGKTGTSFTIPSSVTIIEENAFYICDALTSIIIPASVTTIREWAFYGCTALTSLTVNWTTDGAIPAINPNVFYDVTLSGVTLSVPTGTKSLYEGKAVWQGFNIAERVALSLTPATLNLSAAGATQPIAVTSVAAWTASSDRPWLTLSPANGTGTGAIQVTAEANAGIVRTATVTVTSGSLTQTVTVTQAGEMIVPDFIALDQTDITLPVGSSMQLNATVYPETDKVSRKVSWYSIDKSVATVNGSGTVTGISEGVTSILVVTEVGERRTQCRVRVVSDVSVNPVDKGLRVYAFEGRLHISLPEAQTVRIYNVSGALVKELALPAGDTSHLLPTGFYIVQLGTQVKKVIVK